MIELSDMSTSPLNKASLQCVVKFLRGLLTSRANSSLENATLSLKVI